MPIKGQSPKETVHTEMKKFKEKSLHSGSKHGPLVVNRKQAIAIALSEARKAGKKAEGGKIPLPERRPKGAEAWRAAANIDDRRKESNNKFNDSLYFPPGRTTNQEVYDIGNIGIQPGIPEVSPGTYSPLGDQLGKSQLDIKAAGFAEGGGDDSWKDREAQEGLALQGQPQQPAPPLDIGKGLSRWWYGNQQAPAYGPKPEGELPEADMTQDPVSQMLAAPKHLAEAAGKAYQEGLTPAEQTEFGFNTAMMTMGAPAVEGGIGTGMGKLKYTKDITPEKVNDIHGTVISAADHSKDEHPYANAVGKDLKAIFPKDIATSAFYLGLEKGDIANLKSHMSQGAQGAFDKHYNKLMGSAHSMMPEPQAAPTIDAPYGKGLSRWWYGNQQAPAYGPKPQGELPEADMTQDPVSQFFAAPKHLAEAAGKAYQEGLTPAEQTEFGFNTAMMTMGAPAVEGGLGTGMGKIKYTKEMTPEKINDLHDTVMEAAKHNSDDHPYAAAVHKDLKASFPMNIANSAFYLGLDKGDIANLKSHMSQGSQGAFDKHYNKLMGSAHSMMPEPQAAPTIDAPYGKAYDMDKLNPNEFEDFRMPDERKPSPRFDAPLTPEEHEEFLAKTEGLPNGFYAEPLGTSGYSVKKAGEPNVHYGMGKTQEDALKSFYDQHPQWKQKAAPSLDEDYANYEMMQDQQAAQEQAINEGGIRNHPSEPAEEGRIPTNNLHKALVPEDLEQKSAALGLNTTAFHGTRKAFSEFKNPEELGGFPEIGVHFGTLEAAVDRVMPGDHPLSRKKLVDDIRNNNKLSRSDVGLLKQDDPNWQVIPSRIGANNPLTLRDLGRWTPQRMMDGLRETGKFSGDELKQAMGDAPTAAFKTKTDDATRQIQNLRKLIESKGYDSIAYNNIVEDPGSISYIIWNLNKARSFYAKFDPAKAGSRNLLAGLGGLSLLPLGLYSGQPGKGPEQHMATGGKVKHKQIDEDPQDHEFINFAQGGMLDSHIPGRTDKIPLKTRPGSYVLPADIPSALGEGNSKAGAEILKKMFTHSAYGLPPPHIQGRAFQYPHHLNLGSHKHARGGKVEAQKALPEDHQLGMKVPKGGSMCANCKFLSSPTTCGNKGFVDWNHGPKLPAPADEYCCDLYGHKFPKKADGGGIGDNYNTQLSPQEEQAFQAWKQRYAPNDSGADYDLRGAYKAGLTPDMESGHFLDTFKKPNHPTFSDESQYAPQGNPGFWTGQNHDQFVPPAPMAKGGDQDHAHIIAAGGEFIIHPDVVKAIGEGSMKQGHKQLDKFVLHTRRENIKTLRGLKPPK